MLYSYGFQRSVIHMNAIIINFVCFVYYFFLVFCFVFCNARYTIYIHTYHIWNTLLLQRRLGTREKNAPFIRRQILSFVPSSVCVCECFLFILVAPFLGARATANCKCAICSHRVRAPRCTGGYLSYWWRARLGSHAWKTMAIECWLLSFVLCRYGDL